MRAHAVIGCGFGDEGKGLLVDHLSGPGTLVVRYSGGAQAGHTVVEPGGRRHVHHHFGSGSLRGAATYLGPQFVVNPLLWRRERDELAALGVRPRVLVDVRAPLTTPYDMIVNRWAERRRGAGRHGSCGLGVNESVERCLRGTHATRAGDVWVGALLEAVRHEWVPARLTELGLGEPDASTRALLSSRNVVRDYLSALEEMRAECEMVLAPPLHRGQVVFEGSQGLLLDERHGSFPHVTRASVGLRAVAELAPELGVDRLDVLYVTRTYMTRHGAGPFPSERRGLRYRDDTNETNEFQGALRFGDLDAALVARTVLADMREAPGLELDAALAVTHLDQEPAARAVASLAEATGLPIRMRSFGPTRAHVEAASALEALSL